MEGRKKMELIDPQTEKREHKKIHAFIPNIGFSFEAVGYVYAQGTILLSTWSRKVSIACSLDTGTEKRNNL